MKKPDEIKKGLECLMAEKQLPCSVCPYNDEPVACCEVIIPDALAYIQQLEADNAQQARCIENLTDKLNALNDELAELQAERDAAVALIPRACAYCKWYGTKHGGFHPDCKNPNGCRNVSGINTGWQWRGVQKEDMNEQ